MDHYVAEPAGASGPVPDVTATAIDYASRARFFSVEDGFNIKRPRLHPSVFAEERDRALCATTPTSATHLDNSAALGLGSAATTPLLLASYLTIQEGAALETSPRASGEVYVVLRGSGSTEKGKHAITWEQGDIFCLPGGAPPTTHNASDHAVLYSVSDEPALRFLGVGAPDEDEAAIAPVLYNRDILRQKLDELRRRELPADAPGRALNLSSVATEALRTCLPALTLTFNLIPPGERQRPHVHSAAALVLVLNQGGCHSVIGGRRLDWSDNAVVVTPAGEVHSHENAGDWALALIVQDGGLHYHCGTMGFAFA